LLEKENEAYRLELSSGRIEPKPYASPKEFLQPNNTWPMPFLASNCLEYRIEYVNQAVSQIFGYEPEEP
jgi:PAS domain-containing protein